MSTRRPWDGQFDPDLADESGVEVFRGPVGKRSLVAAAGARDGSPSPGMRASTARFGARIMRDAATVQPAPSRVPEPVKTALAQDAGTPLAAPQRWSSEVGADVSDARVVNSSAGAAAAESIGARAFTLGNRVFFGSGQYDLESTGGAELMRHELTHVHQQRGASIPDVDQLEISSPSDREEQAARDHASGAGHTHASGRAVIAREALSPLIDLTHEQWSLWHGDKLKTSLMGQINELVPNIGLPAYLSWGGEGSAGIAKSLHKLLTGNLFATLKSLLGYLPVMHAYQRGRGMEHVDSSDLKGSPSYTENVALELRKPLADALARSMARIGPRYAMARNQAVLAAEAAAGHAVSPAPQPAPSDIIGSHPIDPAVIEAFTSGDNVRFDYYGYRSDNPDERTQHELAKLRTVTFEWVPKDSATSGMHAFVRVKPADATPEEVAKALFGTETLACNLLAAAPLFGFDPGDLSATNKKAFLASRGEPPDALDHRSRDRGPMTEESLAWMARDAAGSAVGAEMMLNQSKGLAPTGASKDAIISERIPTMFDQFAGISASLATIKVDAHGLGDAKKRLEERKKKLEEATPGEVAQWDAQTAAQFKILKMVATGVDGVVTQYKSFGFLDKEGNVADGGIQRPAREWAETYGAAAAVSDMPAAAEAQLALATKKSMTFGMEMMEMILIYVRDSLANAAKDKGNTVDHAKLKPIEERLRKRLIEMREELLRDPVKVQLEMEKMFGEVQVLQNLATLASSIGTIMQLYDAMEITFWGELTALPWNDNTNDKYLKAGKKLLDWRGKLHGAYIYYESDILRASDGEQKLKDVLAEWPALQAELQTIGELIEREEKKKGWAKLVVMLAAAIVIIAVTMGVGSYVSGALMMGAGWGATTGGVIAATVLTAGAEALTFTVLSTLVFEENPSLGGFVGHFFENWALFGAMRFIALGAEMAALQTELAAVGRFGEGAAGIAKAAGTGIKGAGHALNISGMFAYNLWKADKEKREKTGEGLTSEERQQLVMEGFVVLLGVVLIARYGGNILESLKLEGVKAPWVEKVPTFGKNAAEMKALGEKLRASKGLSAKDAEKLIGEALNRDAAVLKQQTEILEQIVKWAAENKALATAAGIDGAALSKTADALGAARIATERTQLTRQLEPAGGDLFVFRGENFETYLDRFRALGDAVEVTGDKGQRTATVKPKEMPKDPAATAADPATEAKPIRIREAGPGNEVATAAPNILKPSTAGSGGPTIETSKLPDTQQATERWETKRLNDKDPAIWDKWIDGMQFKEAYRRWMEQPERVEKVGEGYRAKLPKDVPEGFRSLFDKIVKEGDMVSSAKGTEALSKLEAAGLKPDKLDPQSPEYLKMRPELERVLGKAGLEQYEATIGMQPGSPARARVEARLTNFLGENALAKVKSEAGDCQVILTGGLAGKVTPKNIKAVELTVVAPKDAPLEWRAALEARLEKMSIETSKEFRDAGGAEAIPVKARVISPEEYFGERVASGGKGKAEVRIDDNFKTPEPNALADRFEATRGQVDAKGELPKDVADLMTAELPGVKVNPRDPVPAVKSYLESQFPGKKVEVEPLGGGKSGAQVFKVTIEGETHIFKIFRSKTEMVREIAALKRIKDAGLKEMEPVSIENAANITAGKNETGGVLMSAAKGDFVKDSLKSAGKIDGAGRFEAVQKLEGQVKKVASAMAEMHTKMSSGSKVTADYKTNEVKWFNDKWTAIKASGKIAEAEAAPVGAKLETLAKDFKASDVDATFAHGDAHAGNFAVGSSGKVQVIDTETAFRSVDAAGKGQSPAATDVGRFMESIRTFGAESGLSPADIARVQQAFITEYKAKAGGAAGTKSFDASVDFYRANLDLIALRGAIFEGNRPAIRTHFESLKSTLGLPSKMTVDPRSLVVDPIEAVAFEKWLDSAALDANPKQSDQYRARLKDYWSKSPREAIELARERYDFGKTAGTPGTPPKAAIDPAPEQIKAEAEAMYDYIQKADPAYTGKMSKAEFLERYDQNQVYDPVTRGWRNRGSTKAEAATFDPAIKKWTAKEVLDVLMGRAPHPSTPGSTAAPKTEASFEPFVELLKSLGIIKGEAELRAAITEVGFEGSEVGAVRNAVKGRYRQAITDKLAEPGEAAMQSKYGSEYDWATDPQGAYSAARHRNMREQLEPLHNSDRGNLTEAFIRATEMKAGVKHVRMTKAEMAKHGIDLAKESRSIDLTDPKSAITEEIKSGELTASDVTQVGENAMVVGKKVPLQVGGTAVTPTQTRLRMTSPEAAKAARGKLIDLLTQYQTELTVVVYNAKGEQMSITFNGRGGTARINFLSKASFETWLGVK